MQFPKKTHGVYDICRAVRLFLWEKTCGGSISPVGWSNASGRVAVRAVASAVRGDQGTLFLEGQMVGYPWDGTRRGGVSPLVIR